MDWLKTMWERLNDAAAISILILKGEVAIDNDNDNEENDN